MLELTLEQQNNAFETMWEATPVNSVQKACEMFKFCFEVDYDTHAEGHKNIYSNLWSFLNRKIKSGQGFKSYVDGRKSTTFIRMDVSKLRTIAKCIMSWNQYVGKSFSKQELLKHVIDGWQINCHPSYAGMIFNYLCMMGYGERTRDRKTLVYTITKEIESGDIDETVNEILEMKAKKVSTRPDDNFTDENKIETKTSESPPGGNRFQQYIDDLHSIIDDQRNIIKELRENLATATAFTSLNTYSESELQAIKEELVSK